MQCNKNIINIQTIDKKKPTHLSDMPVFAV